MSNYRPKRYKRTGTIAFSSEAKTNGNGTDPVSFIINPNQPVVDRLKNAPDPGPYQELGSGAHAVTESRHMNRQQAMQPPLERVHETEATSRV